MLTVLLVHNMILTVSLWSKYTHAFVVSICVYYVITLRMGH